VFSVFGCQLGEIKLCVKGFRNSVSNCSGEDTGKSSTVPNGPVSFSRHPNGSRYEVVFVLYQRTPVVCAALLRCKLFVA